MIIIHKKYLWWIFSEEKLSIVIVCSDRLNQNTLAFFSGVKWGFRVNVIDVWKQHLRYIFTLFNFVVLTIRECLSNVKDFTDLIALAVIRTYFWIRHDEFFLKDNILNVVIKPFKVWSEPRSLVMIWMYTKVFPQLIFLFRYSLHCERGYIWQRSWNEMRDLDVV